MSKKVLIPRNGEQLTENYLTKKGYTIVEYDHELDADFMEKAADVDAIVSIGHGYDKQTLESLKQLTIVAGMGVGYDATDVETAAELGIWVTNNPGSNAITVAESTVTDILLLSKNAYQASPALEDGHWNIKRQTMGFDLNGKTVGIVGFGHIGQEVAKRLVGFGVKILFYNRSKKTSAYGEEVSLERILTESDYVSLHVPATPATHHMIGAKELRMMKPSASLVNFARGSVIDEAALVEALKSGEIRSAALDVFEQEPLKKDSPLLGLDNAFLTPHTGSNTIEASQRMALGAEKMVDQALSGKRPDFAVNDPK